MVISITYSGGRITQLTCSVIIVLLALVSDTKGDLKFAKRFYCPTIFETPDSVEVFLLPKPYLPTKFANSEGIGHEVEEVHNRQGKSATFYSREMQLVTDFMDEVMMQVYELHLHEYLINFV